MCTSLFKLPFVFCILGVTMYRKTSLHLQRWKEDPNRKSLLLRGARQVGKTYSIRELGHSFDFFLEVNFED